ncbi:hypothetical protein [Rhodoplanes azumiensis]|uniref:Cytochrome c domain-containing protein n=1 Tax=Rhodoplanes azumiensis TaxID=1897628 RepID=A0ABW5AKB7_9BRAD
MLKAIAWAGLLACGLVPTGATAQTDLTAGKSPAQMFSSDCSACHKSASGLSRGRDPSSVARFLREHYTSSPANAGALAGYLAGVGGAAPADPRGRGGQTPGRQAPGQEEARPVDPRTGQRAASGRPPRQPVAAAPEEAIVPAERPAPRQRQQQAATAADGQPAAEHQPAPDRAVPPRRSNERLASTPVERLRPYMAAHEPAKPAPAGEVDRQQRLKDYATVGSDAEALRAAALAARPAAARQAAPPPAAGAPVEPTGATAPVAPTAVTPAATEAPSPAGPPIGGAAPTTQSNEDPR